MQQRECVLLDERFAGLRAGPLAEVSDDPCREMPALRDRERSPLWNMSTFQSYWTRPHRKADGHG
jgi:hypothetical protein